MMIITLLGKSTGSREKPLIKRLFLIFTLYNRRGKTEGHKFNLLGDVILSGTEVKRRIRRMHFYKGEILRQAREGKVIAEVLVKACQRNMSKERVARIYKLWEEESDVGMGKGTELNWVDIEILKGVADEGDVSEDELVESLESVMGIDPSVVRKSVIGLREKGYLSKGRVMGRLKVSDKGNSFVLTERESEEDGRECHEEV